VRDSQLRACRVRVDQICADQARASQVRVIEPKVEEATRDLLGHAIRGEWDDFANVAEDVGDARFLECLSLCLRISGYIAIDVSGRAWPTVADIQEIARRMSAVELDFNLSEEDAYSFLARAALGFEPLAAVFPDREKLISVPIFTTAALLVSYRRHGSDWWNYLDAVEDALEKATPAVRRRASRPASPFVRKACTQQMNC